jgi:hypothetical protein
MLRGKWHWLHVAVFIVSAIGLFCYEIILAFRSARWCVGSGIDPEGLLLNLSVGEWYLTHWANVELSSLDSELLRAIAVSNPSVVVGLVWGGSTPSERGAAATADALGLDHLAEFLRRESRRQQRGSPESGRMGRS